MKSVYGCSDEMVKYFHHLTLKYFRGIRCFHFKDYFAEEILKENPEFKSLEEYIKNQQIIMSKI